MKRSTWMYLALAAFLIAGGVLVTIAARGAADLPSTTDASLQALKASFRGMYSGPNPWYLEQDLTKNADLIQTILKYADSSPYARESLSSHLIADLDRFSSRFAPGTQIDEEILSKRPWMSGEEPWYGLTVDAYLLLEMASSERSPAFTKQVLQHVHAAHQSLVYFMISDEKATRPPDAPQPPKRSPHCPPMHYGSTPGAEFAWCCEHFMVESYTSGAFQDLPEAQGVISDYGQWRQGALKKRGMDKWLPVGCAAVTMEYAKKLADALPEATDE